MDEFLDDILNFSESEIDEDDEKVGGDKRTKRNITRRLTESRQTESFGLLNTDDPGLVEEEDLEWISNKDAFPVIETFVGVLPEDFRVAEATEAKQLSPDSVLETSSNSSTTTTTARTTSNSSGGSNGTAAVTTTVMNCCAGFNFPVKARSKRRRTGRRDLRVLWTGNEQGGEEEQKRKVPSSTLSVPAAMGRKCQHCGAEKTPQWRAGPSGPKTLCNACGVRYKSGRLVPEYRPANSPTFSAELHSNSHRKIVEMRKQFQSGEVDRKDCG